MRMRSPDSSAKESSVPSWVRNLWRTVLSRGNSADPTELYRAFMGRDPDLNALLQRSGLAPAA